MQPKRLAPFVLALLLALALAGGLLAQSSANVNLAWHTVAGGGTRSSSAGYSVVGTLGQPAASPAISGSAGYRVAAGFWALPPEGGFLFLPMLRR